MKRDPADVAAELESHLDHDIAAEIAQGAAPAQARRLALLRMGGLTQILEKMREQQSGPFDNLARDARLAVRQLRLHPLFALSAILTLALGTGATTAVYGVARAALMAPLPYPDADRRVMIFSRWTAFEKTWVADQEVIDYRTMATTLDDVAAWQTAPVSVTGDGPPLRAVGGQLTANTFAVLGVAPRLGRTFTAAEDEPGAAPVVVLSDALWRSRFAADRSIVGRRIRIDDVPAEIIGVMPPGFRLPTDFTDDVADPSQFWRPLQLDMKALSRGHGLYAAARLAPGQSAASATAELAAIARALTARGEYRPEMRFTAFALTLDDEIRGPMRPIMWLLTAGVSCLLLIACVNVSSLLLVRGEARAHELAVRRALGAAPLRLGRQLGTEGAVLAMVGTLSGIPIAIMLQRLLVAFGPQFWRGAPQLQFDWSMAAVAGGLAIANTVLFSVAPITVRAGESMATLLRNAAQQGTASPTRVRLRTALTLFEVGVAMLLLVGAGLMLRSLDALHKVELGFDPHQVTTLPISLPLRRYPGPEQTVRFFEDLHERASVLPGVTAAGIVRMLPLATTIGDRGLDIEGYDESTRPGAKGDWQVATPGAFDVMRMRLVRGRWLTDDDRASTAGVAVINETLAKTYWPSLDAAMHGRLRVGSQNEPWVSVVGIVADERHNGLTTPVKEKFFIPLTQWHVVTSARAIRNAFLVVRTAGDVNSLTEPLSRLVNGLDPELGVSRPRAMDDVVDASVASSRLTGLLLTAFALIALALAAVGLYGVVAYSVSRRTREIGIRLALGSERAAILRLVMRQAVGLALGGIVWGGLAALVASRVLGSVLYQVRPTDPTTFVTVSLVVIGVAVFASLIPGLRASRVNPIEALRQS